MFFTYVRVKNCNRFKIAGGHKEVKITCTAKMQSILGTNGTGKSSLLQIGFSPIPPSPDDFYKPGEWEVHITHHGKKYQLIALYGEKNSYSFIVDGENLNRGQNITKMLELIKEHLNFTPLIGKIVTGATGALFTDMTAIQRRDVIAMMNTADFTYAFAEFKRFTQGMNKAKVLVKHFQDRINAETPDLILEEDLKTMVEECRVIRGELNDLMREPKSNAPRISFDQLQSNLDQANRVIETLLVRPYPEIPKVGEKSWNDQLVETSNRMNEVRGAIKVRAQIVTDNEQKLRRVEILMKNDPKELEASAQLLEEELAAIPKLSIGLHESLLISAPDAMQALRAAVGRLPGKYVSPHEKNQLQEAVFKKRVVLGNVTGRLDDLLRKVGHIDSCQIVSCPSCAFEFKPGIDPNELVELKDRIVKGEEIQKKLTSELESEEDSLESANRATAAYAELEEVRHRFQNKYPGLFLFIDQEGGFDLGKALLGKLAIYEKEVVFAEQHRSATAKMTAIKAALSQYKEESGDYFAVKELYINAVAEYDALTEDMAQLMKKSQALNGLIEDQEHYAQSEERFEEIYASVKQLLVDRCDALGDDLIEESIKELHNKLGIREQAIYENEQRLNILKDLKNQLVMAENERIAYTRLWEEISPKTGMIAEQISAQLGAIVESVNDVIRRCWAYPLFLKVGDVTEQDVDYKFPMMVDGDYRADISLGSKSILSIINQAWRIVFIECLNLEGYPLHLDELGSDFDEVHRQNLVGVIKDMLDGDYYSQILMINHNLDGQSSFPNSETIILNDTNIDFRHPYNQHVEFA